MPKIKLKINCHPLLPYQLINFLALFLNENFTKREERITNDKKYLKFEKISKTKRK
jgi:hypothetical protein